MICQRVKTLFFKFVCVWSVFLKFRHGNEMPTSDFDYCESVVDSL